MRSADLDAALMRRLVEIDAARTAEASARTLRAGQESRFSTRPFGRALAMRDLNRPEQGFLNRVVGFGAGELGELDALVAWYAEDGIACQLDLTPDLATPPLIAELAARGFRYHGGLLVFRGVPEPTPVTVEGVSTAYVPPAQMSWALLEQVGAAPADVDEPSRARRVAYLAAHPELEHYVATIDGEPVAIASLLVLGDACHLSGANTRDAMRGRGAQRALLQHRVDRAARAGLRLAVTDTWFGTSSHRNVERVGFQLAWSTSWWQRPL